MKGRDALHVEKDIRQNVGRQHFSVAQWLEDGLEQQVEVEDEVALGQEQLVDGVVGLLLVARRWRQLWRLLRLVGADGEIGRRRDRHVGRNVLEAAVGRHLRLAHRRLGRDRGASSRTLDVRRRVPVGKERRRWRGWRWLRQLSCHLLGGLDRGREVEDAALAHELVGDRHAAQAPAGRRRATQQQVHVLDGRQVERQHRLGAGHQWWRERSCRHDVRALLLLLLLLLVLVLLVGGDR